MVEQAPEHRHNITAEVAQAIRTLFEQSRGISDVALLGLEDGEDPVDPKELATASLAIEQLGHAGREILDGAGDLIFPRDKQKSVPVDWPEGSAAKEEERKGPKTFGELLRTRIDAALPPEKDQFTSSELATFLDVIPGFLDRAIITQNLSPKQTRFTREDAVAIIQVFLTTPSRKHVRQEMYSSTQLKSSFLLRRGGAAKLNELCMIVGHDWSKNPMVDYETAMQIRGLVQLELIQKD